MTDPFEVHKAAGGMRPLRVAGAAMGRGLRQSAGQAKQGQWSSAGSTLKQSTKTSAKMTGIGAKRTGSGLNDKWNKAGFGTKLAVTGAGVGTLAGVGAYAGNKIGKSEDHDPFEVEKSWKKIEPKLISADRAILHRTLKGKGASPKGKDARNAEYIAGRRDRGYLASSHVKKNDDPFEVHKSVTPGVRMVAASAKPKRVQAAQDVMAMKGSGKKTLKAMDKLRPKK